MLIAGTQSGCGKTTVTLALMQYLRARHIRVAPYKAGPDFLDPMWHQRLCGRDSYNLDTRMIGADASRQLLQQHTADADLAIIEGAMGLFDGRSGVGGEGSSADLANVLDEPVLLVVHAKGMSGSIVPLVEGFVARAQAMQVEFAGIIANHVGSANHARILRELLATEGLPPLVAWMDKNAPRLPERHLGLQMPSEQPLPDFSDCFHVENSDFFTAQPEKHAEKATNHHIASAYLAGKTVAVARDAAFCFIYPANIDWLQAQGATVRYFSPLAAEMVPADADALWLPGGYPELHLQTLRDSDSLAAIAAAIEAGMPALAECGGMMVLGQTIDDVPMAGVLPCRFAMQDRLTALGYREAASGVRGHEFHHSKRAFTTEAQRHKEDAFSVSRGDAGMRYNNLRASYIHWYFPSQPEEVASWFQN